MLSYPAELMLIEGEGQEGLSAYCGSFLLIINKSTHLSGWLVFTSLCGSHWHVILTVPHTMFGVFLLKLKGIFAVSHNIWCAGAETDHDCNSKEEFIAVGELGDGELNEVMQQFDLNLI